MKIVEKLVGSFKLFDQRLTETIKHYVQGLVPDKNPPTIAAHFTDFFKIIFYSLVILIPFLFLKILHPYNRKLSAVIIVLLGLIGILIFGVILGLIQLAFTF